jgi:hypothetical protein
MKIENVNPLKYYVLCYSWHQYAWGITGQNTAKMIFTNNSNGYDDRKAAQTVVSGIKKRWREANRKIKKEDGWRVGAMGGKIQIVRGDKLEKVIESKWKTYPTRTPIYGLVSFDERKG